MGRALDSRQVVDPVGVDGSTAYWVGIDENGLGARMGPLIVTAVLARVSDAGAAAIKSWHRRKPMALLGDSKQMIAHGDVRLGEAWARILAGGDIESPAELVESVSSLSPHQLKTRCPRSGKAQCWAPKNERFKANEWLLGDVKRVLSRLQKLGIHPSLAKSRLVCTSEINERGAQGENRFLVDLHCMEELVLQIAENHPQPTTFVCGKVGGMNDYPQHFAVLNRLEPEPVTESAEASVYRFKTLGEVRFVRDADALDPLVMLASLVGKYMRELFMDRIGSFYANQIPDLRKPSGYHDQVTGRFAELTAELRSTLDFPSTCFERTGARDR